MTTTTAAHLRSIALSWPDLRDALGAPTITGGFGQGLRGYLAQLEEYDAVEAAALRALERSPHQLGDRPAPVRIGILDTMRILEATLTACADDIARTVQREPMPMPTARHATYTSERQARLAFEDRQRRATLARADLADPQRWRYTGRRSAPHAALWLLARIERRPGPCRRLNDAEEQHIGRVAAGAAERVERALDIGDGTRLLDEQHACGCGGQIEVRGGAGATPVARCTGCGCIWSEAGVIAA